jgi:hypothetical protein
MIKGRSGRLKFKIGAEDIEGSVTDVELAFWTKKTDKTPKKKVLTVGKNGKDAEESPKNRKIVP